MIVKGDKEIKNFTKEDWARKIIEMRYLWLNRQRRDWGRTGELQWKYVNLLKNFMKQKRLILGFGENWHSYLKRKSINKLTQMFLDNIYEEGEV